uniref:Uncharacterized protein n=1 Tax=Pyxicephalus adspersus TaxID=30357 RepID=A0AAV3A3L4_PYXAD|nr:TPA: hypothetical protein GDO54_013148 [Pyxicephalus adspersus]
MSQPQSYLYLIQHHTSSAALLGNSRTGLFSPSMVCLIPAAGMKEHKPVQRVCQKEKKRRRKKRQIYFICVFGVYADRLLALICVSGTIQIFMWMP